MKKSFFLRWLNQVLEAFGREITVHRGKPRPIIGGLRYIYTLYEHSFLCRHLCLSTLYAAQYKLLLLAICGMYTCMLYLSDDLMLEYTLCVGRAQLVEVGQNTSIAITWNLHDQNL
jgi:hypothetical protein